MTGDNDLVVGHYHPGKRVTVPRAVWARIKAVSDSTQRTVGLLEKPLVHFEDLDGDGQPEWVVEQIAHAATGYSAAVYHYFQLRPDLGLHRVCAIELRAVDPASGAGARRIVRRVARIAPAMLRLETLVQAPDSEPRQVAEAMLESHGPGQAFMVMERRALDPRYEFAVITALRWADAQADESRFVREGPGPP